MKDFFCLLLISSHPNELFLQRGTADHSLFSLLFISLFYYHFLNVSLFSVLELPESVRFIVKSFARLKIFFLPQRKEVLPDFFFSEEEILPDFSLHCPEGIGCILKTKWLDLIADKRAKAGVSDMYPFLSS